MRSEIAVDSCIAVQIAGFLKLFVILSPMKFCLFFLHIVWNFVSKMQFIVNSPLLKFKKYIKSWGKNKFGKCLEKV